MSADKENPEEGQEVKVAKPKSNLPMLIIIIVVVLLVQLGVAFAVIKLTAPKAEPTELAAKEGGAEGEHGKPAEGEHGKPAGEHGGEAAGTGAAGEAPVGEKTTKKPFEAIVNIAGTDATRYLKVEVAVAFDSELEENKGFDAAFPYEMQVKNTINQYLSSLTLEEATDKNAQLNIRGDLLRLINELIPEHHGEISNVYITQYIIQ